MASAGGTTCAGLIEEILATPGAFDLFQAIRIIDSAAVIAARTAGGEVPPEPGGQSRGAGVGDAVRFRAAVSLGFPGGAIAAATRPAGEGSPVELAITCFGLIGVTGILPQHYTTLVLDRRAREKDRTFRDFLDIFHHRAVALLYQAWGKYRVEFQRERWIRRGTGAPWLEDGQRIDGFTGILTSLVGLGTRGLTDRLRCGDDVVRYHTGSLSRQPVSAATLETLIADALGVPVTVEQFVGRWLVLDEGDQTRLASSAMPQGAHACLGVDALLGQRCWSVDSAFAVRLGPLSEREFSRWLPGGGRLEALGDLLRLCVGPHLEILVLPMIRAADVPATHLSFPTTQADGTPVGSRLGWNTWLVSRPPPADADDAVFPVRI